MISIRKEIKQVETGAASKDNNVLKVRVRLLPDTTWWRLTMD